MRSVATTTKAALDWITIGRSMSAARSTSFLILLVAAGCLQPGPLPEGRNLASGRDIRSISFVSIDGVPGVLFNRVKTLATPTKGMVSDLWLASWDGTQQRLVVAGCSDRWSAVTAGGSFFTMVDEQEVASGGTGGGQAESIGTLVRIDSHYQPGATFDNVSTFTLNANFDDRLLYRQVPTNNEIPGLFLWDGQNSLRLGDVATVSLLDVQIANSGMAYFVLGSDQVLSRLGNLTDTVQDLHANVSRFLLRGDEQYAALSLLNAGTSTTVVLDVQAGKDILLARPNPCCWLGFTDPSVNQFTYVQSASAGAPAEYHTLDLATGIDTTLVLPAPLVDLATILPRPQSDEDLYLDSQGHGVFFGHDDQQVRGIVQQSGTDEPVRMLSTTFTADGQYFLYIAPQPTTEAEPYPHGPLMVQDSGLLQPPRQLSTPGMSVAQGDFFFIPGPATDAGVSVILVFWANVVADSSDLYFADYETGELKVVASAIGSVTVDAQHIFGTVNESAQDETGDLVVQDVDDSGGRTIAHAVTEATQWSGLVAYVVRGRVSSDRDGLWATTLAPPGYDGGQ
jgi:hypothetical protein